jgi:predicted RNA-binding Zn ribbon-like protein
MRLYTLTILISRELKTLKFKMVGGHGCLDFVNTVGGWGTDAAWKGARDHRDAVLREKLLSYPDLVAFSQHTGVITKSEASQLMRLAKEQPRAANKVFKRGLELRRAIYRLFRSVVERWQPATADLEKLNEELLIALRNQRFVQVEGRFTWGWYERNATLDRPLWPLALSAAELLASADLSRVRQCRGESCGWMFLDTSRNRSRQWCDMKDCGNLAKVRRFRRRLREK